MFSTPSTGITSISPPSTAAASTHTLPRPHPHTHTAPTTTTTSTATTSAPGPAAVPGSTAPQKRPAASDLQRSAGPNATPSKRQATGTSSGNRTIPNPSPLAAAAAASSSSSASVPPTSTLPHPHLPPQAVMPTPAVVTEDQLLGRTPEQLIALILQIQAQHQQTVAQISAQYENINQQLTELRGSLVASYQSAASALSSREPSMRPIVPPPPLQQTAVPCPPRPSLITQTPSRPARPPGTSPSSHPPVLPRTAVHTPQSATGPPQYDYRTVATVDEVWKEYREGMDGQPAIEALDANWGSRWRPEPRGRTWYSRRKVIWDKIKEYMAEGMDEDEAVREVEKLRDGGTINKLIRMLQDERKDRGGDESMIG